MLWLFGLGRKGEPVTDLKGHLCLVTGASRGIGEQICLEFAKRRATLILVAQNDERLKTVAEACRKCGATAAHAYSVNLFQREDVEKLADDVVKNHGDIDVLVNNAGIASTSGMTALKGDPFEWEQMTQMNLITPMHLTRKFAPAMANKGYGVIINMGSLAGMDAVGPMGSYCATKWGIRGWSLSLHNQLKEYGIKVCLLNPAGTLTDRSKSVHVLSCHGVMPLVSRDVPHTIPDRFLVPKDIAEACLLPFRTSANCVPSEITLKFAKMPFRRLDSNNV